MVKTCGKTNSHIIYGFFFVRGYCTINVNCVYVSFFGPPLHQPTCLKFESEITRTDSAL